MSNEEKSGLKHWVPAFVLMVCVVLAFFDKISIAVLFSDPHFQSSMGIAAQWSGDCCTASLYL